MKHIVAIIACAALLLTGCTVQPYETGGIQGDSSAFETAPVPGRSDREIIEEYKTVKSEGEHDVSILFMNAGKADSILVSVDAKTLSAPGMRLTVTLST